MSEKILEAEIVEDELKAPILKDIKYPVKMEDLEALMSEYKNIPVIDLEADDEVVGEQYQIVLRGHKRFVKARTSIEKVRKGLKAPALEYGKKVDTIAKEFQSKIKPFEDKLLEQRKAVEDNEARKQREAEEAEEKRIADIKSKLEDIKNLPLSMMLKTAQEITDTLCNIVSIEKEEFQEFYEEAIDLVVKVREQLTQLRDNKELVENAKKLQDEAEVEARRLKELEDKKLQDEKAEFEAERAKFQQQKEAFEAQQRAVQEEADRKEAERLADELQAKQEAERADREKQKELNLKEAKRQTFEYLFANLEISSIVAEQLLSLIIDNKVPHTRWED